MKQEILKRYPDYPSIDDIVNTPLRISRNTIEYHETSLPGDGDTTADLPYDERTGRFAHVSERYCTWTATLPCFPDVEIEGTLRLEHSVDPDEFPWLAEQAEAGQRVVLKPGDYVSQHVTSLA